MVLFTWSSVQPQNLGSGDGGAKDAEHRPGVKAAGHHRRNEIRRQPLHDLVAGHQAGEEVPARGPCSLRGHEGARDDAGAGMGEHAKGVQLAAGHGHLGVGKSGPAPGHGGAVHHDGGAVVHPDFVVADELHRLLAAGGLRAEEHRRQAVQRDALGAIDHRGGEIVIA